MNKYKNKLFGIGLGMVLVTAVFFRFYHFPSNPPSLNWDEVAYGYNAYSVLKTGRDEFGKFLPLYFRSLDDYKLPVNMYLTAGSIAVFGYNDFSVRFPSAFLGTMTVVLLYFLVKELTDNGLRIADDKSKKQHNSLFDIRNQIISQWIALLSSFLLAILPWHIQFSRMAAEANVGLFFLVLGAVLFLKGIHKKSRIIFISVFSFGLSAYSYLSFRIVAPLLGLTCIVLYWKELRLLPKKYIIGMGIVAGLIGFLLFRDTFFNTIHIRFKATSVFNTKEAYDIFRHKEQEMFVDAKLRINLTRRLFHDTRLFTSADIMVRGYLTHFSPTFLFFDYDQKQHHTPFVGLCYIFMLPFIPLGFYCLVRKFKKREALFIISWLLIAPIPASVTWDIPHAIRVYSMVIPLMILMSLGVYYGFEMFYKKKVLCTAYSVGLLFILLFSSYYYFHQYMIHLPIERSKDWVYGRKELTSYLESNKQKYDRIIVSSSLEWPYIFLLYYSKYDPGAYLRQGGTVSGSWEEEGNKYDTYEFHKFRAEDLHSVRTLFVGKPDEFIKTVIPLRTIYYLDGTPAIYIAEGDGKI
jgi:4-amino-4-deoxy-L-arabinose transferase-like glycosyltransferase